MTTAGEVIPSFGAIPSALSRVEVNSHYLVGLDLVFSGASGYCIYDNESKRLLEQDLLDTGDRSSSDVNEKIKRGRNLFNKLAHIAFHFPQAIWIIEITDWVNSRSPQRERETLKSLALARGLAYGVALIYQTAIPFVMGVNEVRDQLLVHHASKIAQFEFIRLEYQLKDLEDNQINMNITDSVALADAFLQISQLPPASKVYRSLINFRLKKAIQAYQNHTSVLTDQLGSRRALLAMPNEVVEISLAELKLATHMTPEYRKSPQAKGQRWAAIDISATHPGVVVYDRIDGENPHIVFHHTFILERPQPDRKKARSAYEIAVASNILRLVAILKAALDIQGIIFEYSDWHRAGRGAEFHKDRDAIDSLFFSYGVLMAAAYQLKLPLIGVNALEAKARTTGKKNSGKTQIKAAIDPHYPFLKNEHTRDAAALMLSAHGLEVLPESRTTSH
jgi:hypothetical protein